MRLLIQLLAAGLVLALFAAAGGFFLWQKLHEPFRAWSGDEKVIEVESGQGAAAILADLEAAGVLRDARLARAYLVYVLRDPPLIAGEYRFEEALTTPQVLDKLTRGEILTYPVTLIEGLTLVEAAESLARQGFGDLEVFLTEMERGERVAGLDPEARNLEGYLYPDTYHFARGTSEAQIVDTLVRTFEKRWREQVEPLMADSPFDNARQIVTLASVVEKEARLDEERPLIAGVYAHRLRRGIALYADPTVIYAKKLEGTWDGNLRRPDLKLDSPYNTYVYPGLPPGPICSPAVKSLVAAAAPAATKNLYFVSRNDGSHVFAETLAEHNRNVEIWQRRYWRERWAAERRSR